MTTVALTTWGNSIGVRIPAAIVKAAHLQAGEMLEITTDETGRIILKPLPNPRAGWLEAFNLVADKQQDSENIDIPNAFDEDDWTW